MRATHTAVRLSFSPSQLVSALTARSLTALMSATRRPSVHCSGGNDVALEWAVLNEASVEHARQSGSTIGGKAIGLLEPRPHRPSPCMRRYSGPVAEMCRQHP